ncbi:9362_t:CDS:2, partial [Gigaspora rosea]
KYPKEIVGPFEFGEYRELEGSKQNKKDINEYKADEYESGIEKVVLLDEFYTKIDWNEIINLLNNTSYRVEIKHKGFEPFVTKYIFLTARKPPNEAYNFGKRHDNEESDKEILIKEQQKSYYKGDENKFRNMCWDIKYCIGEDGIEKTIEESKKFNQNIEGEHIVDGDNLYW